MHLWNLETGAEVGSLTGDHFGFHSASAVPQSNRLLTTSQFGGLNLWDITPGTETLLFKERGLLFQTALAPSGKVGFSMHTRAVRCAPGIWFTANRCMMCLI